MPPNGPSRRQLLGGLATAFTFLVACSPGGEGQQTAGSVPSTNDDRTTVTAPTGSIDRLHAAINSHDAQQVADCFTTDYRAEVPHRPAEGFTGSAQVLANWIAIFGRLPDLRATVLRRAESGPETWSEWEMVGTGPDGARALMCGPAITTTRDGRINWSRFYLSPVPFSLPSGAHAGG